MGVHVLRGRGLADTLTRRGRGPRVAIVNQALAGAHFEDGAAVGRNILVGRGPESGWFTVVGVVENHKAVAFGGALQPPYAVYVSVLQLPPRVADLLVRPLAGARAGLAVEPALCASLGDSGTVLGRWPNRRA